jgi:hypothetical protein
MYKNPKSLLNLLPSPPPPQEKDITTYNKNKTNTTILSSLIKIPKIYTSKCLKPK